MYSKTAFVVLLLVSVATAGPWQRESCVPTCSENNKFLYETGRTYEYKYVAETLTSLGKDFEDSANIKVRASVSIQPVTPCEFILTLTDVSLDGSPKSAEFAAAVTRNALRFAFQDGKIETVCSSERDPSWVLNFKKGILSNFQNSMEQLDGHEVITETDILGECEATYSSTEEGTSQIVKKVKYPSSCSKHVYGSVNRMDTVGYAIEKLLQGLPLGDSLQTCYQKVSDGIIKSVSCEETNRFSPFAAYDTGIQVKATTNLELVSVRTSFPPMTDPFTTKTDLTFEHSESDHGNTDVTSAADILKELEKQSRDGITKDVPRLFTELTSSLQTLDQYHIETLYYDSEATSRKFITDALLVVGTPAATEMIVKLIRQNEMSKSDQDAWITSLAFIRNPSLKMFSAIQSLLETQTGTKALLGVSALVHNYCQKDSECVNRVEIENILRSIESYIGVGCRATSNEEKDNILLALKALGNAGRFVNAASVLKRCYTEDNPMEIRVAAIDAWRRIPCSYDRNSLQQAFADQNQENEIRIASYLAIMKCPTKELIEVVKDRLTSEGVNQVTSFVWTHLLNLQESASPEKQEVGSLVREEMLQNKFSNEALKLSRNFESSFYLTEDEVGGMTEANVIFASNSFLPRSALFNMTIDLFGETINLFEVGGRIEGFEKYIEKFFGPDGYYPEETIETIVKNLRKQNSEDASVLETYMADKSDDPEGSMYLKVFGNEVLYRQFHGVSDIFPGLNIKNPIEIITKLLTKGNVDYMKNFNLIDTEFSFPTSTGFPVNLQLNGVASLGFKLDGRFDIKSLTAIDVQGKIQPSAAVKVDAAVIVDAFVTKSGVKMTFTLHSSTEIDGRVLIQDGKVIDVTINMPKDETEIFEISREIFKIENEEEIVQEPSDQFMIGSCSPLLLPSLGMGICSFDSTFKPFSSYTNKIYLRKTDSHTAYNFRFSNDDKVIALLLDMPGSATDKKWALSLSRDDSAVEVNFHSPYGSVKADLSYIFSSFDKQLTANILINNALSYSMRIGYVNNKESDKHSREAWFVLSSSQIDLFNFKIESQCDQKTKGSLHVAMSGIYVTPLSLNIEMDKQDTTSEMSLEMKSVPIDVSLSGQIIGTGTNKSIKMAGTCRLFNNPTKSITTEATLNTKKNDTGTLYSGEVTVKELDFEANWCLELGPYKFDSKIAGRYQNAIFSMDDFVNIIINDKFKEANFKTSVYIPSLGIDVMAKKNVVLNSDLYKYEIEVKDLTGYHLVLAQWSFNKDVSLSYDSKLHDETNYVTKFKFGAEKVSQGSYKIELIQCTNNAIVTWNTSPGRFTTKAEGSWNVSDKLYQVKWDIDADQTELNMEGSLNRNGQLNTIFAKASPTSLYINNTFYKPVSVEASVKTEGKERQFLILASSEDAMFRTSATISQDTLQGSIKFGEIDVGIMAQYQPQNLALEAWWSPTQKVTIQVNYRLGNEGEIMVSAETPFQGLEKQVAALTFSLQQPSMQGQLSITWANSHHLTITAKSEDFNTGEFTPSLLISSTIPGFERIQFTSEILFKDKVEVTIQGSWGTGELKGTLTAFDIDNVYKAEAKFVSSFTKDFEATVSHNKSIKDIATFLHVVYGSADTKISLKANIIDKANITGNFICKSPYLPEVSINGVIKSNINSKTLEIKGNFNEAKIMLFGNCETQVSSRETLCKLNLIVSTAATTIVNFSFTHEKKYNNEFETDFNFSSEFLPSYGIKGHIEGQVSSLLSAAVTGYISGPKINGRINLNHKIVDNSVKSGLEITFNSFNLNINTEGKIDLEKMELSSNTTVESSCPMINGIKIRFDHNVRNRVRNSLIHLSNKNYVIKLEHSIEITDLKNWSNHLLINDRYGIDNVMSSSQGVWHHETKITIGEKLIEASFDVKIDSEMEIKASFNSPWTSLIKLSANHKSVGSAKQSDIKFEYGNGKCITIESEYETGKYNKIINVSVKNEDWSFCPLKAEIKISSLEKKSLEIFITSANLPSLLMKLSSYSNTKDIQVEVTGVQKYYIHCLIEGTSSEGTIKSKIYIPIVASPLTSDISYTFKGTQFADFRAVNSFEHSSDTYTVQFMLRDGKLNAKMVCPHGESSLDSTWKIEGGNGEFSIKLSSPFRLVSDISLDIFYKGNPSKNVEATLQYGAQKYVVNCKYDQGYFEVTAITPIQDWEEVSLKISWSNSSVNGEYTRNKLIYNFNGHINVNYQRGETEVTVTTPLEGYKNNRVYLRYSFLNEKGSMLFSCETGSKKIVAEYNSILTNSSTGEMSLSIATPWKRFEKLSLRTVFKDNVFKVSGIYNKYDFEWILKTFYNGNKKANFSFILQSNVPEWRSFAINADLNGSQKPYSAALKIEKEGDIRTYAGTLNFDRENFSLEIKTPIERFETIRVGGNYYHERGYLKTSLSCSNGASEISFSGYFSMTGEVPNIRVKILTPFAGKEQMEFMINGSLSQEKSLTISATIGEEQYLANVFAKTDDNEGRVAIDFNLPFAGLQKLSLRVMFSRSRVTNKISITFNWDDINFNLEGKINDSELNLDIESSIPELRSLHIACEHKEMENGYSGRGKVTKNGTEYGFEGKATSVEDGYEIEATVPVDESTPYLIKGSISNKGIRLSVWNGNDSFTRHDFEISYVLNSSNVSLNIYTPFEIFSLGEIRYKTTENKVEGSLTLKKYTDTFKIETQIEISPKKSEFHFIADIPTTKRSFNIYYDIESEAKNIGVIYETGNEVMKYILEAYFEPKTFADGYVKFTSSCPEYSLLGLEYKFQWRNNNLNDIDCFVSIFRNSLTRTFGVKTQISEDKILCIFQTPFAGYERNGFEAVIDPDTNEKRAELMLGEYKFSFKYGFMSRNYFIRIETPFEELKMFDATAKFTWDKFDKCGVLKFVFNNIRFEICSEIRASWTNPLIKFKFETPFQSLPLIDIISGYSVNLPTKMLEFGIKINDWIYWLSGEFNKKDQGVFIKVNIKSPIKGLESVLFDSSIDLGNEEKLVRVSLESNGVSKVIIINGKLTDDEMNMMFSSPFDNLPNFQVSGSRNRSKRSVDFMMLSDHHVESDIWESFKSLNIKATTPFEKAKEISLDVSKSAKGEFTLAYKRDGNFIDLTVISQGKKKGFDVTVKSALPGWELLALAGRLDLEEIRAYISGQKGEKKMEITGSGTLSSKTGNLKITVNTPYPKYESVTIDLDYNSRRNIITFNAESSSSDFHILVEFKRGLTIDVFVPNPTENTVAKGKFTLFKGDFTGTSRFTIFRTLSIHYSLELGPVITAKALYERNGVKIFEFDFLRDSEKNMAHLEAHGRLFGNHSMVHIHRDGWKKMEFKFHRNGKEFHVVLNGSGDLPLKGTVNFTIHNAFREVPKHIEGTLIVDRTTTPKTLKLEVHYPGGKIYTADLSYKAELHDLKTGEFTLHITTPQRDDRPWKHITGSWTLDSNMNLSATLNVGQMKFKANGKIGFRETNLTIDANVPAETKYILQWKIQGKDGYRDYYLKVGRHDRYVMAKLQGTFNGIFNADIAGAFRISRFMQEDFVFTDKWSTDAAEGLSGDGTFEFGRYRGSTHYTYSRDSAERATKFTLSAKTNINKFNNLNVYLDYNIKRRIIDFKIQWDSDQLYLKTTLDNFTRKASSNTVYAHIPGIGGGELTLSHDFNNPLAKSVKLEGTMGQKKVSYIANWTRNEDLTIFNFVLTADSTILGKASLHVDFDVTNLSNATATLEYKREGGKFVTIKWHRKKTAGRLENELIFSSHFTFLPSARFHVIADWSTWFELQGGVEWKDKKIDANVKFSPNKVIATVVTPFKRFGNISVNLDYNFEGKTKEVTFKYARGDRVIDLTFKLDIVGKKTGSVSLKLTTPYEILRTLSFDGNWKKGQFTATYKRNDVQVDFEGTAEVKLDKSSFDLRFTIPKHGDVVLQFSYDLEAFVKGTGKTNEKLVELNLEVVGHKIHFTAEGKRTPDNVFIEINGSTTLDDFKVFYLKLDSELNVEKRVGHFEIKIDDFYYKVKNEFEKRKRGFYARSIMDSSGTPLPGLIIGFGKDGDAYIATIGYGEDREVSVSFKGKDGFRKGFSGKIDIPRRQILDLQYDVKYAFKGDDKLDINVKIVIGEGRTIDAEILYSSEGVKARLLSPWTGEHRARARRSVSDDHFLADIGIDDYGFALEGNSLDNMFKKGFQLEGEFFGKKFLLHSYLNFNGLKNSEGKVIVQTPFKGFENLSGYFTVNKSENELHGKAALDFIHELLFVIDLDLNNKVKGDAHFQMDDLSYTLSANLVKAENNYEGTILLLTPHKILKKISADGVFQFTSYANVEGVFKLEINEKFYDVSVSHVMEPSVANLDLSFKANRMQEYKLTAFYSRSLNPLNVKIDFSKYSSEDKMFNINFNLFMKSFDEIRGNFEIQRAESVCRFTINMMRTENSLRGDITGRMFDTHEMLFRIEKSFNSLREIVVKVNSPTLINSSLRIFNVTDEPEINVDFNILTKNGTYRTVIKIEKTNISYDERILEVDAELIVPEPNKKYLANFKAQKNSSKCTVTSNLQFGTAVHIFQSTLEFTSGRATATAYIQTPVFEIGEIRGTGSVSLENEIQIVTEILFREQTHRGNFRINIKRNSLVVIVQTPILSTGIGKFEVSAINGFSMMDTKLHLLISDTERTLATTLFLNLFSTIERKVSVEIQTPFTGYERMNFGLEYSTYDVTKFSLFADPLDLKAGCYFGVTDSVFNAGVQINTAVQNWEVTEAMASIPLNTFAPKMEALVQGVKYGFESRINESANGGEFFVKGFSNENAIAAGVKVKTQVPYEVQFNMASPGLNEDIDFGIRFDSSFLLVVERFAFYM